MEKAKQNILRLLFLLLFILFLFTCMLCIPSSAETLIVDQNDTTAFSSVNQAIADSAINDTIIIKNGIYEISNADKIIINKPLTISGEHTKDTIIKQIEFDNLIEINADHVSIKNLTLQGEFQSIIRINANHTHIENIIINPVGFADAISTSSKQTTDLFLKNISAREKNAVFTHFTHLTITDSLFSDLIFQHVINATISECMFTTGQTTLDQHTMYTLFENCTFADAEFTMFSMNGEKNILHACLFQQIGPLGNALDLDGTNNQIKQCTFKNNTIAINVFNTNNTITHNNFINNTEAAVIASPIWLNKNETINVNDNWWGNKTGPSHPTVNPNGLGDNISGNIECSTWLNQTIPYQALKNRPRYIPPNQDDKPPNQNDDDQKQTADGMNYTLFLPLIIGILAIIAILLKKR